MNVHFGSIRQLPQMDSEKNISEQLQDAKAENRWGGVIFSRSWSAIDTFSSGKSTGDLSKAAASAAKAEKRLADKPHPRVHVVLTDDDEGQHLTMYRFLKKLDIKPAFIWDCFIQPILNGDHPSEEIGKVLSKMDTSYKVDILELIRRGEKQHKQGGEPEENNVSSRPLSEMKRTKSVFYKLGNYGSVAETEEQQAPSVKPISRDSPPSPKAKAAFDDTVKQGAILKRPQSKVSVLEGHPKKGQPDGLLASLAVKPVGDEEHQIEFSMDDVFD